MYAKHFFFSAHDPMAHVHEGHTRPFVVEPPRLPIYSLEAPSATTSVSSVAGHLAPAVVANPPIALRQPRAHHSKATKIKDGRSRWRRELAWIRFLSGSRQSYDCGRAMGSDCRCVDCRSCEGPPDASLGARRRSEAQMRGSRRPLSIPTAPPRFASTAPIPGAVRGRGAPRAIAVAPSEARST
jgi:hypothetical protein